MKAQAVFSLFLAALVAAGCGGSPGVTSGDSPSAPDLTGNWQIQPSVIPQTIPPNAVLLLGALGSSGNQVSGTFRFSNLGQPTICGVNQVVTLGGAIDANNKLTLSSPTLPNGTTIKVSLQISGGQPYSGTGTIEVDGAACAFAPTSALGVEIANASGSFTGALTPGALGTPVQGTPGTATLILTQSTSPGSDGQFAATGSLSYQFGSCSGNASFTGAISGVGIIVSTASVSQQTVSFIGLADNAVSKITSTAIFAPAPCSTDMTSTATYSGVLAR